MNRTLAATLAASLIALPVLAQDNPFAGFKGKMRDGNWEYKMKMEGIPGMPAGQEMSSASATPPSKLYRFHILKGVLKAHAQPTG